MIDSHCHLADEAFAGDREAVIQRAKEAGVTGIVVVAEGLESSRAARALCAGRSDLWATAGLHPHRASEFSQSVSDELELLILSPDSVAVGETGLDYHYDNSPRDLQRASFAWHLALSASTGKPAIVHSREAGDDTARAIGDAPPGVSGVLHCFASGPDLLGGPGARFLRLVQRHGHVQEVGRRLGGGARAGRPPAHRNRRAVPGPR